MIWIFRYYPHDRIDSHRQPFSFSFFFFGWRWWKEGNGALWAICTIFDLQIAGITCHNIPCKIPQITMLLMFIQLWYPRTVIMNVTLDFVQYLCHSITPASAAHLCKCADNSSLSESGKCPPVTACLHRCQWKICWWFWDLAAQAWLMQFVYLAQSEQIERLKTRVRLQPWSWASFCVC